MRTRRRVGIWSIFALALGLGLATIASPPTGGPQPPGIGQGPGFSAPYIEGEVLLKFKPTAGPAAQASARAQVAATKVTGFRSGAEHWRLGPGRDVARALSALRNNPNIEYAEPNYVIEAELAPNDPRYPELYGMNNTGQTGGTPGADIDAERAWNVSTGSPDVVVAVIDTGVDYNHPDLIDNIWTNPGEIPGNGIDDDNNGFVDDIHGWDFSNNDSDPFDDNGHGTHCSGTIGGVGDNGVGVAGVSWNVSIMGVKFLGAGGSGSTAGAISSIDYATMMGVDIMSNSWGGGGFSQALLDAINAAAAQEIIFVAAAGNSNSNNDVSPHYPSNYDAPNVISVAATDHNDAKASFSSYGATTVDLGAPGVNILSTLPGNSYGQLSGTSMATPHVSGAAALLRAVAPDIGAALARQILMNFADPVASMDGITVSGGRLNAFFPIAEPDDTPPGGIFDLVTTDATSNSLFLAWTATGDDGTDGTASTYDLRYSTSPIDDGNFALATKVPTGAPLPSGSPETAEVLGLTADTTYYVAVKARDEWGNAGPLSNVAAGTTLPPPTFASSPASFSAALLTGQSATRTLTVQNAGVGTLDWRVPLPAVSGVMTTQHEFLDVEKGGLDPRTGDPVVDGFGGPDAFGYRWMDSDEAGGPAFMWNDIAASGTVITELDGDDEISNPIPLGFDFSFYGETYDSVRVCTNGWVSFTSSSTAYSNQPLPNSGAPENVLAPFWDDLHFRSATRATWSSDGSSFIVQFTDVDTYATGSSLTFQVEVRNSGEIFFRYLNMAGSLSSNTVGIQNATKTDGLTVAFNAPYVHDELEVRIAAVPQWLTASPTSGRLYGGESADITVTIDATGLDGGMYEGSVNVESNDPLAPVVGHPVMLDVTGAPAISVSPLALDFGQVFVGFTSTLSLHVNNTGTDTLTVSSITSSASDLSVDPASFTVPAHGSQTVAVTYSPVAPGPLNGTLTINSDASNASTLSVDATGYAEIAPVILVSPTSLSSSLYTGGTEAQVLTVSNTGGSDLILDLSVDLGGGAATPTVEPDLPKGDTSADGSGDYIIEREGGPDAFGYRFKDSDAPGGPAFNWSDISGIGTPIDTGSSGDETNVQDIPIGFPFSFYGNTFETVNMSTNGWLSFTSTVTDFSNTSSLPSTGAPENLIAPWHDDLDFNGGIKAHYYNDGSRFILQYTDVEHYPSGSSYTFQVILYPSGKILYQYLSMSGTLNSATIGIQNADRSDGLLVSANEAYIHDNMAIEISRTPDWLAVSPTSATIPPGGSFPFTVTFDAGDSGDKVFNGAVRIDTNIPDPGVVTVPASLTVFGVADVATSPEAVDFGTRFIGYPHLLQLAVQNVGTGELTVFSVTSDDPQLFVEEPPSSGAQFSVPPGGEILYNLRWVPSSAYTMGATVTVSSDDPDEPVLTVPVIGTAIPAPVAGWSPTSFVSDLFVGETETQQMVISNSGGSDLEWTMGVNLTGVQVVPQPEKDFAKGEEPIEVGDPVTAGAGGPDMYGYRWKDSDEPGGPVFDWTDISTTGTPLDTGSSGDDVMVNDIPIGFPFEFYGNTFETVNFCTNGWLSFTARSSDLSNGPLPGTSGPENLLAAWHDDLDFNGGTKAHYTSDGSRFILQYTDVEHYPSGSSYTFQVILYPGGKIVFQYLTMSGVLESATIGIQNATRDDGLQVAYNQAYIHDNLAIAFQAVPDWLTANPTGGVIPPGGSVPVDITFDARNVVGGTYSGGLRITTNDPVHPQVTMPATLTVTGFPAIAASPAALDFGTVFTGVSSDLAVTISNPGTDVLSVTGVTITGDYSTDTSPFTLGVGETRDLTVTFAPADQGPRPGELVLSSNATGMPTLAVPLTGEGLYPPAASVNPTSFQVALPPAGTTTRNLRLLNTGFSDLFWNADVALLTPAPEAAGEFFEAEKGDESANGTGVGIERAGGPDAYGYRYRDSDEAGGPAFNWVDISGVGTPVDFGSGDPDDRNSGPFDIGFSFPFYGETFDSLRLCTNGWMSFTSSSTDLSNPSTLPSTGAPENLLSPFHDDLKFFVGNGAAAYTHYDGSRFIIQYDNVGRFSSSSPADLTFQVILYPSGKIVYQYLTVSGTLDSATIGIQNGDRTIGLLVSYNETYVHDGLAIEFSRVPDWLTAAPTSGVIPAGEYADIQLSFNAAGLDDGDYPALVSILSNDPFNGLIEVPVSLHVGEVMLPYLLVEPNTLNLSSNGKTVRAAFEVPEMYDPYDVVISSLRLNGVLPANPSPVSYADENGNGILEVIVKFDRAGFEAIVPEGDNVMVTLTGEIRDITWFRGHDTIRTIRPTIMSPNGGEYLVAGQTVTVSWSEPQAALISGYSVWLSRDGGNSFEMLASDISTTSWDWVVDGSLTDQAVLRVYSEDGRGVTGYDSSDGAFTIAGGINPPNPVSSLEVAWLNGQVHLDWKEPLVDVNHAPVSSYRVLRSVTGRDGFVELVNSGSVGYVDTLAGIEDARVVMYRIVATNAAGDAAP